MSRTQRWRPICPKLQRVQERARAYPQERFTSLAHLLTEEALLRSYRGLRARAAAGIDGETKASYGKGLRSRLMALHAGLKAGTYRALPGRRKWEDKPDGGKRPISIWSIEDKIVQGAVVEVLHSIYEEEFRGFSYGFRPGRSPHQALQALQTVLQKGEVNWVLDLDLKQCFDRITHEALIGEIQRRVNDRRLLRLIRKWLTVGVVEKDGRRERQRRGVPQGAVISPLLANIVLHQAMDEVVHRWRTQCARGQVYIVRYADDAVLAFEHEADAHALRAVLDQSLAAYGLEFNQAKTRLLRFGRHWPQRGQKSESFDFLGLTHIAGKDRCGRYLVRRKTAAKRFRRTLHALTQWCCRHRHEPVQWQCEQLGLRLRGHYAYFGVRGNLEALQRLRQRVWSAWCAALRRRSQRSDVGRLTQLLSERFVLPHPRITHADNWLPVSPGYLLGRAGCGNAARPVL